jgi:hypothetical protein
MDRPVSALACGECSVDERDATPLGPARSDEVRYLRIDLEILGAPGRIRTCDARLRSPYRASSVGDGKCLQVPNLLAGMRW